jgi:carbon starvation protein
MHALYVLLPILCILVIAYRYYSGFLAAKVLVLDDSRVTPAHTNYDGHNYYPTTRWVLFGHHFAAITGAGPLVGPVLAAQFGYAPGLLWLVTGVVLAGTVHDLIILWASTRRGGRSLAEIAHEEIGTVAGITTGIAILFIVVIALAGLGLVVVNALSESAWGTFTIGATIPLALFMGFYMYRFRKGHIREATVIGVIGLLAAVAFGKPLAATGFGQIFMLSHKQLVIAMATYGFLASVLPVWMLLAPRDYLSSFMKIGTIALLIVGVMVVNPELHMPAMTKFVGGGGPIIPGPLFPFVFITIACGAISGFHGLIGSGTTPKMIDKESDIRPIGYGAMLIEGLVGIVALLAATSLHPGDYFAINVSPKVFATLGLSTVNLQVLEQAVGESVTGRTGGAVSLAVGMAQIFSGLPGMKGLMDYWYHFAIMFEALFILTTIDAGTRVARFLVQEFFGRFYKPFARTDWMPGTIISTLIVVVGWGYFIWTGSIGTIWPMFGISNQLLAVIALLIGTTILINQGRAKYVWVTALPMVFLATTTLSAGFLSVRDNFWPMALGPNEALHVQGYVDTVLTVIMMSCVVIIVVATVRRWVAVWRAVKAA